MYSTFNRAFLDFLQTVRLTETGHYGENRIEYSMGKNWKPDKRFYSQPQGFRKKDSG